MGASSVAGNGNLHGASPWHPIHGTVKSHSLCESPKKPFGASNSKTRSKPRMRGVKCVMISFVRVEEDADAIVMIQQLLWDPDLGTALREIVPLHDIAWHGT